MVDRQWALGFADEWVSAWNSHDIDRIIRHYAEDVSISSPIAANLIGSSQVEGIEAVNKYFLQGLQAYPDLKFEVLDVLCGQQSIVLSYINHKKVMAAEFMLFDNDGKIKQMYAHYSE